MPSTSFFRAALVTCGLAFTMLGCAAERPQNTVSPGLDSGVTSSNGGGMRPSNFGASAPIRTQ